MLLKDRTRKRLRWFLGGTLLLGCLGVAGYFVRDRHLESDAVASRDAGLKFLEEGDYFHALHSIGPYVRRHPDDAHALYAYAKARREVPEPNNRHIADTVGLIRRVVALSPGNVEAKETLLTLYQENGLMTEALQLSQDVLATDAKNRVAMKAKALALASGAKSTSSKQDDALAASEKYNELWPADIDMQLLTMELLNRKDPKGASAIAKFEERRKASPQDPLAILLVGVAHLNSGDTAAARKLIEDAAKLEMPDAAAVQVLVRACDQLEMYGQSMDVLRRHAALAKDEAFEALLAGRLWELDSHQELATRFDGKIGKDAQAAALRCLALNELGQKEQARAALQALKNAEASNPSARDWAGVIGPLLADATPNDGKLIDECQQALRSRNNPYVRFIMAEAYFRAGDPDAALQAWLQARAVAPAWSAPLLRLGQVVAASGDADQALAAAQHALKRSPGNARALLLSAEAQTAKLKANPAEADKVLKLIDQIAKQQPKDVSVLPLRVLALGFAGRRGDAVAEARRALDPAAATPAAVLVRLASISRELKLGIEDELLGHCERVHGMSPQLAMFKAKKELDAGHKAEAVQLFEQAKGSSPAKQLDWDVARANLLEALADPRAKDAWIALADANPTNAQLQWACVGATSVQKDRAAARRILDRLKEQYGDRGLRWRLAHAQWLFDGRNENPQLIAEAALVLNDLTRDAPTMVPAKLLLAECQFALKPPQISGAIAQLTSAAALRPDSSEILVKLAKQLHIQGDSTRARPYLDAIVALPTAPFAHVREAAAIIDAQGDAPAALAALEKAYGTALKDLPADLLLANLYRKTNQPQRVEAVLKRLLESPNANAISFAAEFYAAQGRAAEAAEVLKRLDQVATTPGEKEVIRGSHALRGGDTEQALSQFTEATRVAPANPIAWRELIRIHLRKSDHEKALTTARMAQAATANDRRFAAFVSQGRNVLDLKSRPPELVGIWDGLLDAPDREKTLADVIALLPTDEKPAFTPQQLNRLVAIADEQSQILPLQSLVSRLCMAAARREDAARLATRVARGAPANPMAAQVAVAALADAQRWSEVLEMAGQWRRATPGDTLAADQMIAVAHTALGNPRSARDQLSPHIEKAQAEPEKYASLLVQYAQLQAAVVSPAAAAEILRPRIRESARWRVEWMKLAASALQPPDAVAWLDEVDAHVATTLTEQIALAEAWHALARRTREPSHNARAAAVTARAAGMAETGSPSAQIALSLAGLHDAQGDVAGAERFYRKAMAMTPPLAANELLIAQNNLAMLLAQDREKLDEALDLALKAVRAAGSDGASFYDTLAFVRRERGEYASGIEAIEQALKVRPDDAAFQLRFATILVDDRQFDRAKPVLGQLKELPRVKGSPEMLKQVEALEARITSRSATAGDVIGARRS